MIYIQLIGLLAFCVLVLSYYKKDSNTILTYQITSNLAYAVHYFLLGGLSGAFISFVGAIRNIIFVKVKQVNILLITIFTIIYLIITIIFYESLYSIFPMCANICYLIFISKKDKKNILIGAILNSLFWMLYSAFVYSIVGIVTESILIIFNTVQLKMSYEK